MPKMKHPEAKGTIDVRPDQVEMYQSQGWSEVEAEPEPTAAAIIKGGK